MVLPVLPVGVDQSLFDPIYHIAHGNAPLLLQHLQGGKNLRRLAELRLRLLLYISGHDDFLLSEFHPEPHQSDFRLLEGE